MIRHWYNKNYIAFCGKDLKYPENHNYVGYLQITECTCIKCLQRFIKIKNNRLSTLSNKFLAQKTLDTLTYREEFDKLINEEEK